MFNTSRITFTCFLLIALAVTVAAAPLGTGFSYQGKLTDSEGRPLSGPYSMNFRLFDAETGGTQVGNIFVVEDVNLVGGLFTVQLDFGAEAFSGQRRWLEIRLGKLILSPACRDHIRAHRRLCSNGSLEWRNRSADHSHYAAAFRACRRQPCRHLPRPSHCRRRNFHLEHRRWRGDG